MKNENPAIFAEVLEEDALEQFEDALVQPFTLEGALMADAHLGYTLPIGGVMATDNYVLPAWVGYDIGCGMCALRLDNINVEAVKESKKAIFDAIYECVPVGFNINWFETEYSSKGLTEKGKEIAEDKNYRRALGSLGGGNHFIEIGHDLQNKVWVIIHSGSRGVGHGIATHYIKKAHPEGKAKEGHYGFTANSPEGRQYIQDLSWCLRFALANREEIMRRVVTVIRRIVGFIFPEDIDFAGLINCNHNHAEYNFNKDCWIHRKGATHAEKGMLGVIPGNMLDGSFIVRGKGNPRSLYSSSHGAGRVLGRKQAKRELNLEVFEDTMQGVQALVTEDTLDESPLAYKNIFDVMKLQKDLVAIEEYIKPIINIKG